MPTTATSTWGAANRLDPIFSPWKATEMHVALTVSTTYAKGTVLGEVTATPGTYRTYASGNVDGSQVAKAILKYACVTDASGNITLAGEFGQTQRSAPVYIGGGAHFKTADLVGLDAGAVTNLGASLVEGTVSTGILRF